MTSNKQELREAKLAEKRELKERKEVARVSHKKFGQYFTTDKLIQDKMVSWIANTEQIRRDGFLEPGVGRGHLVKAVLDHFSSGSGSIKYDAFEIDQGLDFLIDKASITFQDFTEAKIDRKYPLIIGNPPFVKTKKGNLYIDFVRKSLDLLSDGGEMIFVIPSGFFKMTRTVELIQKMLVEGSITHIFQPDNENLFDQASVDIIVFRYCKDPSLEKIVMFNSELKLICNSHGLVTFVNQGCVSGMTLGDLFDGYVGLVSGKEEVFKNSEVGNVEVLNDQGVIDKYVLIKKFPSSGGDSSLDQYLVTHKQELLDRKIRKFGEKNWFQWGALRNMNIMEMYRGQDALYIRSLTRQPEICFRGKIDYFGGRLIMLRPKDMLKNAETKGSDAPKTRLAKANKVLSLIQKMDLIADWLNSDDFQKHYHYSGRFKIGQRQLLNSVLPPELAQKFVT